MLNSGHRVVAAYGAVVVAMAAFGAQAREDCTSREDPAKLYPGLELGSSYPAVKDKVPSSAGCAFKAKESCEFVDKFGIENLFSNFGPTGGGEQRALYARTQYRERGGWLPYGVKWSDTVAQVAAKLKPHGGELIGQYPTNIWVRGCWSRDSDGYSLSFEFDAAGKLVKVEQVYQVD